MKVVKTLNLIETFYNKEYKTTGNIYQREDINLNTELATQQEKGVVRYTYLDIYKEVHSITDKTALITSISSLRTGYQCPTDLDILADESYDYPNSMIVLDNKCFYYNGRVKTATVIYNHEEDSIFSHLNTYLSYLQSQDFEIVIIDCENLMSKEDRQDNIYFFKRIGNICDAYLKYFNSIVLKFPDRIS
jgi:hypothetical protein